MFLEKESFERPPEQKSSVPEAFVTLRNEINALAGKPLEERFSQAEMETNFLPPADHIRAFIKKFTEEKGQMPKNEDLTVFRNEYAQRVKHSLQGEISEVELMRLLRASGVLFEGSNKNTPAEVFDRSFACENEECEKLSEQIEIIYSGYGRQRGEDGLSGDYFAVKRQKTEDGARTDVLLLDAQGHGGGATPLATLAAAFLRAGGNEEGRESFVALDEYLMSLHLNRKDVSLEKAVLEEGADASTKKLSFMRAGEGYALWIDGTQETGYVVKIVSEGVKPGDGVEVVSLEESSGTSSVGDGLLPLIEMKDGRLHPQVFDVPKEAAVFFSSDGIFDMLNRQTGETFKHDFSEVCGRVVKDMRGKVRKDVEDRLFTELQSVAKKYEQTDDITLIKLAA